MDLKIKPSLVRPVFGLHRKIILPKNYWGPNQEPIDWDDWTKWMRKRSYRHYFADLTITATSVVIGTNAIIANQKLVATGLTRTGTAQAGASSTITLDSGASATNSFYNYQTIIIQSGTGAGQTALITGYVGSTKVATISGSWLTNPDNTSVFATYITAGQAMYSSGTNSYSLTNNVVANAAFNFFGISLNAGTSGQSLQLQTSGQITIGATTTLAAEYFVSGHNGGICPVGDVTTGLQKVRIGYADTTTTLTFDIRNLGVAP